MASIGHIAVGMVAARGSGRRVAAMTLWSLLSLLPDVDVVGFAFGVPYAAPWGHRGATHSLAFAVVVGAIMGLAAAAMKRPALRVALLGTAVLVSHDLLDTMTDGGLGCAVFWPFDRTRYFAAWRPIPVAPIGLGFLSLEGVMVALVELALFAPVLIFALRRQRPRARTIAAVVVVWLVAVSSTVPGVNRDAVTGVLLREDTAYGAGFSEAAFRTIEPGQSDASVRQRIGLPHREVWFYTATTDDPPDDRPMPQESGCLIVTLQADAVSVAHQAEACRSRGIVRGQPRAEVIDRLGSPLESCWQYTWSPGGAHYRLRVVCVAGGKVRLILRKWA